MEDKGYPKIQWSVFVKNGKDTQYVIRADSKEEFATLKQFVLAQVAEDLIAIGANVHTEKTTEWVDKVTPTSTAPKEGICATCGQKAVIKSGVSKKGPWTGLFCTSGDRDHTKWS